MTLDKNSNTFLRMTLPQMKDYFGHLLDMNRSIGLKPLESGMSTIQKINELQLTNSEQVGWTIREYRAVFEFLEALKECHIINMFSDEVVTLIDRTFDIPKSVTAQDFVAIFLAFPQDVAYLPTTREFDRRLHKASDDFNKGAEMEKHLLDPA